MEQLSGLGKIDRERLWAVLRGSKGTIEVRETASKNLESEIRQLLQDLGISDKIKIE